MDEHQLRYFVAIAEAGSLTRAGQVLHVTQPAMSAMLRKLEGELGVRLFDRAANRIELNACGKVALVHARALLERLDRLKEDVRAEACKSLRLSICFCDPGPQWHMMPRFRVARPDVEVQDAMREAEDPAALLRKRDFDIYVAPGLVEAQGIRSVPFLFDQCYLSVPQDSQLAGRESVSLADIPAQPLVYPQIGGYFQRITEEAIRDGDLPVILMKNSLDVSSHLIRATNFLAMVSTLSFELRNDGAGRVVVPIKDPGFAVRYHICHLKENERKARPFIEWAAGHAAQQEGGGGARREGSS